MSEIGINGENMSDVRSLFKNPIVYDKFDKPYTKEKLTKVCSCGKKFSVTPDTIEQNRCGECEYEWEAECFMECYDECRRRRGEC